MQNVGIKECSEKGTGLNTQSSILICTTMAINFKDFGNKLRNTEERSRAKLVEEQIQPTPERERFFSSDVFSIGRTVLIEGVVYEIVDKRSNYVVVINESGEMTRKFPIDLVPVKTEINYPQNTFKGVQIPTGFESVVENSDIIDPVGMIKMFECFSQKNFKPIFESANKIGIDYESLSESTKADQLQAISIISGAIGIKLNSTEPQKQVDELLRKSSQKHMTPDQKKIFSDMLTMLDKLGLKINDVVKESIQKYDINYDLEKQIAKDRLEGMIKRHSGNVDSQPGPDQSKVGHTLHQNDTARMMRVRKLMGH